MEKKRQSTSEVYSLPNNLSAAQSVSLLNCILPLCPQSFLKLKNATSKEAASTMLHSICNYRQGHTFKNIFDLQSSHIGSHGIITVPDTGHMLLNMLPYQDVAYSVD